MDEFTQEQLQQFMAVPFIHHYFYRHSDHLGSANGITNLNNKNNRFICIYQKFVVPSTNYPKRAPLEVTVALWCKLQDFKQTKSHLCKHRQFFCLKSCKFENFVVPLQPVSFLKATSVLLDVKQEDILIST